MGKRKRRSLDELEPDALAAVLAEGSTIEPRRRSRLQRGSLELVGATWYLRVRDVVDERGRRARRRYIVGTLDDYATRELARAESDRLITHLIEPAVQPGTSPTFAELVTLFRAHELRDKGVGTQRQIGCCIDKHLIPAFAKLKPGQRGERDLRIHELTPARIRAWQSAQLEAGARTKTIRTRRDYLLSILGWAERVGFAAHRPSAHSVRIPRGRAPATTLRDRAYAVPDRDALVEASTGKYHALYALLAYTGLRIGEALALTWPHVDIGPNASEPVVRVRSSVSSGGNIGPPKSRASVRDVPMPRRLVESLRAYHREQDSPGSGYLFPGARLDQPLSYSSAIKHITGLLAELGIEGPPRPLHGFRHTYVLGLADADKPLAVICELAGWGDLNAAKPYLRASNVDRHAVVESVHGSRAGPQRAPATAERERLDQSDEAREPIGDLAKRLNGP